MKLFIKCNEANHTCDKTQYKEASFLEKVKLNIHLIYCTACRKYTARNSKLTRILKKSCPKGFPEDEKKILKEKLRKEISK